MTIQVSERDKVEAIASLLALGASVICTKQQAEALMSNPEPLLHYFEGIKRLDLKTKSMIAAIFAGEVAESLMQRPKGFRKR